MEGARQRRRKYREAPGADEDAMEVAEQRRETVMK